MEGIPKDLIDLMIKVIFNELRHTMSENEKEMQEKKRRDDLRKGSIDAEYRVIK